MLIMRQRLDYFAGAFLSTLDFRNSIRCRKCNDVIESKHVHDFVPCSCGAVFVDGGHDYQRLGGFPEDWENLSIYGDST